MESPDFIRFFLAFSFVMALMGLLGYFARRFSWGKIPVLNRANSRLCVREVRPLDAKYKMMIVQCDTKEYLLVLGPEGPCVIDSNLTPKAAP